MDNVKQHDEEHDERTRGRREDREQHIPIIVNGREKAVTKQELTMADLIALAFENPPTGQFICFTITYRRGHGNKPEGTLLEGETVKPKKGMIFNVTATDKS